MDYIIFIAIVAVVVLAILFWPKKKGSVDSTDTTKKQGGTEQIGHKGAMGKSAKRPIQKGKKANRVEHKQKRTDSAELTDDELLQADNDTAQNKEFLKEFDNALSNTGDTLIQDETAAEEFYWATKESFKYKTIE